MRFLRAAAVVLAATVVALLAATAWFVVWPREDEPGRADAVVVLAGGEGERLREGLRLMARETAPVLVISHGRQPGWTEANELCEGAPEFEVVCFDPRPDRTQGEARAVARLARERGWDAVVVVTSEYHVTRSRLLFDRCLGADVRAVGAERPVLGGFPGPEEVAHEWASYGHAFLVERGC